MIVVDRTIPFLTELLAPIEPVTRVEVQTLRRDDLVRLDCRALFIRSSLRITPDLIEATAIEFIGSVTSGCDHIAPEVLEDKRYRIALAPGANANAVAEYVLTSLLLWSIREKTSLATCTIGIVGFGNIGRRVAEYCLTLGMDVLVNDPPLADQGFLFPTYITVVPLTELLVRSTVITVHVPLVRSGLYPTVGLLDQTQLRSSSARLIIQTSRGGIITERALLERARYGVSVAVDVWEREPDVSPTLAQRALLATPHIAGHSINAKFAAACTVAQQYYAFRNRYLRVDAHPFPERITLSCVDSPEAALELLLHARQFDRDHHWLRRIARMPKAVRIPAIAQFRATYPERTEVFRTTYDLS